MIDHRQGKIVPSMSDLKSFPDDSRWIIFVHIVIHNDKMWKVWKVVKYRNFLWLNCGQMLFNKFLDVFLHTAYL